MTTSKGPTEEKHEPLESPRARRLFYFLLGGLAVLVVAGFVVSLRGPGGWISGNNPDPLSLFAADVGGGSISCRVQEVRLYPGGAPLVQLLESFAPASTLTNARVPAQVEYRFRFDQDWESAVTDGRWTLAAPPPEGPFITVDSAAIQWRSQENVAPEDAEILRQMLAEKTRLVIRSDEVRQRDAWLGECRAYLTKTLSDWAAGRNDSQIETVDLRMTGSEAP